ncbi:MerR family transcriptional regulator, partial [Lentzea sp.]|uniref:MerR family transcriptional regulator n=1 Tax=Lentzea sp. TaxID=56099 RepID=UPI002ED22D91
MDRVRTPIRPDASSDAIWTPAAAARLLGIAPSTLRCWHRRYRLGTAGVDPGRHRRYTAAELDSLTRMKQLIADGLSPASAAVQAFRPVPGAPAGPRAIVDAALRLDADALVGLLGAQFAAQGTEWTWDRLCRPALTSLCAPRPTVTHERVDVMHLLSGA